MTEVSLHVRDEGEGDPLLLLHGLFSSHVIWEPIFEAWSAYRRIIAPDLPGFGKSSGVSVPNDIAGFAATVALVLDRRDITHCDLLGYSMGGLVAQQLALDRPDLVRRLVLCSTKPSAADGDRFEPFKVTIARLKSLPLEETVEQNISSWFARPVADARALCFRASEGVTSGTAVDALKAVDGWDIRNRLAEIRCPVLLVTGDRDRSVALETCLSHYRQLNDSAFCVVPECGHVPHLEQPDVFMRSISAFLQS